jgi:hypothetical protein
MEEVSNKEKAKELYEQGCNAYLQLFCEKHDFDFDDAKNSWVGNDIGGIVECGDFCVGMQTIIEDIDLDAPKDMFIKWYDYCLIVSEFNFDTPNFKSYVKGCPIVPQEAIDKIKRAKQNLYDLINEQKEKIADF